MKIITCSDCGFTAHEVYFNVEDSQELDEVECPECGSWTTL